MSKSFNTSDYPALENCLCAAGNLTKNADIKKYRYWGYGVGFDRHGSFSSPDIGLGKNVIFFGVDMSPSTKIENRKKDILILGEGPTQGLEHILSAGKMYSYFLQSIRKSSVWICIIMEQTVICLLMVKKFINSKQKILRL